MKDIENGWFVVDHKRRVGLTAGILVTKHADLIKVQYGNSGPFREIAREALRYATEQEVEDAGLKGVGGQIK